MELTPEPTVVMRISEVGPLTVLTASGSPSGGFSISLLALPQGFAPTDYQWVMGAGTSAEQRATGKEVHLTVTIGSKGSFVYDHEVKLTAKDDQGNSASATYLVHLNPPAGRLTPFYDDPLSRLSASHNNQESGRQLLAYGTVLVKAETEGLAGHKSFVWRVAGRVQEAPPEADSLAAPMFVSGDSARIESYEGVMVEASVQDEVGQSLVLRQFVEAVVSRPNRNEPSSKADLPRS